MFFSHKKSASAAAAKFQWNEQVCYEEEDDLGNAPPVAANDANSYESQKI
jgi:hypothetical protein